MLNYQIYHNTCKTLNNFGLDDFYIHFVRVIHCLTVYVLCSVNQTVFLNSSFQSHACSLWEDTWYFSQSESIIGLTNLEEDSRSNMSDIDRV
jgi:hypothetical protein